MNRVDLCCEILVIFYDENILLESYIEKFSICVSIMDSRIVKQTFVQHICISMKSTFRVNSILLMTKKQKLKKEKKGRKKNGIFLVNNARFRKRESHRHSKKEAKYFLHHLMNNE